MYRVITIPQPYASFIVMGHKRMNASRHDTKYRGPLLIKAGKNNGGLTRWYYYQWREAFRLDLPKWEDLPFEAIIGQVNLADCVPTAEMEPFWGTDIGIISGDKEWRLSKQEMHFGNYADGGYAWLFSDPVKFEVPIQQCHKIKPLP